MTQPGGWCWAKGKGEVLTGQSWRVSLEVGCNVSQAIGWVSCGDPTVLYFFPASKSSVRTVFLAALCPSPCVN